MGISLLFSFLHSLGHWSFIWAWRGTKICWKNYFFSFFFSFLGLRENDSKTRTKGKMHSVCRRGEQSLARTTESVLWLVGTCKNTLPKSFVEYFLVRKKKKKLEEALRFQSERETIQPIFWLPAKSKIDLLPESLGQISKPSILILISRERVNRYSFEILFRNSIAVPVKKWRNGEGNFCS